MASDLEQLLKPIGNRYRHLSPNMKWSVERQFALSLIRGSKGLRDAKPESLVDAVLQAASMGLTLNPAAGLCYLIPRKARRMRAGEDRAAYENSVRSIAYASPSYKGLIFLARDQGVITYCATAIVFADEDFKLLGPMTPPRHVQEIDPKKRKEKDAIGVYCTAVMQGGGLLTEYMDREMVLKVRAMSEFPGGSMWDPNKFWTQGWRKAVIRRAWNSWPKSDSGRLMEATQVLNTYEGIVTDVPGDSQPEAVALVGEQQITELHAVLTDHGRANPDRDLNRLALRFGHDKIEAMPLAEYGSALEVLKSSMARALSEQG